MPDRKSLGFTLWPLSSLVLLVSVLFAPIATSGSATAPSGLDCPNRHPAQPTTDLDTSAANAVPQVNALPSDDEGQAGSEEQAEDQEQDRADALDEPRIIFLIPRSFCEVFDRQWIAPRQVLSLYPLRC